MHRNSKNEIRLRNGGSGEDKYIYMLVYESINVFSSLRLFEGGGGVGGEWCDILSVQRSMLVYSALRHLAVNWNIDS